MLFLVPTRINNKSPLSFFKSGSLTDIVSNLLTKTTQKKLKLCLNLFHASVLTFYVSIRIDIVLPDISVSDRFVPASQLFRSPVHSNDEFTLNYS